MRINNFLDALVYKKSNTDKKPMSVSETKQTKNETSSAVVNPGLYSAYNGISFKGKPYDGTHFREDLEKRAEKSTIKLNAQGEEKELTFFKTKHSEYVLLPDTNKIYKLKYVDNKDRITQQIMASKLYQSVGVRTPEYIEFEKNGKTGWMVEVFEEQLAPAETNKKALYESFIADVWLGNRNGLSKDNTMIDKDGNPVKMSVSGSLGYRASGKAKDNKFGYEIDEIKTMRDPSLNSDAAKALADMSDDELYEAVAAFASRYDYDRELKITQNAQYHSETCVHNMHNVLNNRYYNLMEFPKEHKDNKILEKRGLLEEGHPRLTNLNGFDRSCDNDYKSVLEITDEQWEKLKERGLFDAKPGLKKLGMLDYKYLAKMTDEEHQTAVRRNLYAHCKSDEGLQDYIGGAEISELCKLNDIQWENVEKRNLLDIKVDYNIDDFWLHEFINQVVDMTDYEWSTVLYSGLLDTGVKAQTLNKMLETAKSDDVKNLAPPYLSRIRMFSYAEKDVKDRTDKKLNGDVILDFAAISNDKWQLLMEITKDLTDIKMSPDSLKALIYFDTEMIDTLRKRNLLTTVDSIYGLKDVALLSDEEWANVKKRKIEEMQQFTCKDWAYLASLTDEQFKFAQDKKLFENRQPETKFGNYYGGDEISMLVNTLDEKGWQNFEKRGLFNKFKVFKGLCEGVVDGDTTVKLVRYSDKEFKKFQNIQDSAHSYIYPSTVFELMNLNETEYNRLMERDLFQYMNTHEALHNCVQDAPVMKALAELDDKEYATFLNMKNDCKTIAAKILIIKADKLGLSEKEKIRELIFKEKKEFLKLLMNKSRIFLSNDFQKNYNCTGLIPGNVEELSSLITKLVKSAGIDTRPLEDSEKTAFFNALDKISAPDSEFKTLNLKNPDFKLTIQYNRNSFINDIKDIVKDLDKKELMKVWDYFGFEISVDESGRTVMSGYPALINNGEKLREIENLHTKAVIERIKPYVKKFTVDNKIFPDGRFVSPDMAQTLSDILKGLPELYSVIGKVQHKTHDYTVDIHTLAVLQECINNQYFNALGNKDKKALILVCLLHDITKTEHCIDKSHPKNSAYDAYFILKKFGLENSERLNIYQLIKNHDLLEHCNKAATPEEQKNLLQRYAYELRSDNLAELAIMLTKADLKSVKRDGSFFEKYQDVFREVSRKLRTEVKQLQKTAIPLPQTRIPKASELKADGVNVEEITTTDSNGNEIKNKVLYLKKGLDLSKYGFDKGVSAENFNVIVHGFNDNIQQVMLDALNLPDMNALLSTSYVFWEKGNYHTFRPQGFIKNIPAENIGVAYYRDFGSGCQKTEEMLIDDYIQGGSYLYRKYFSDLMKKELNLSDEQYIDLYQKIKDKPIEQIEKEFPYAAYAIRNIFSQMEVLKRKFQRDYNEVLVGKGQTTGVFFVGKDDNGNVYKPENIPEFLRKYAQDNDLPVIYLGE